MRSTIFLFIKAIISLLLVCAAWSSVYMVDETEQVVIVQLGRIVGEPVKTPGIQLKLPFIQEALFYPKNLLQWDGDPGQIPTREKTYIVVDTFARWKITDPIKFRNTVIRLDNAYRRLNDIIDPAVRNFVTSNRLIDAVRKSNRDLSVDFSDRSDISAEEYNVAVGREKITEGILKQAQPKLDKFGIELVDVKIKRINYEDTVRKSVYNRMIAERKQMAEKFRSEGQGEARKIIGQKERDLKEITSEAYRRAQELKGKADADAARIFAEAFSRDPEFYSFTKTLEIYKDALKENTSIVLSTDSEFLKYLKDYPESR